MAYTAINFGEFAPYKVERVAGSGIKKITWDKIASQDVSMPFDVYIVPAEEGWGWGDYVRSQKHLQELFNSVYLLWGHDVIYAGKSVDGDRILGHIADEVEFDFDFQMLFVPNIDYPDIMTNWTSDFMAYIEALMIGKLKENSAFCKNKIAEENITKKQRDFNLNAEEVEFADNIVELIFDAFLDVTYCSYLVPKPLHKHMVCVDEPVDIDR